jgi:hypothetical protein
MAVMMKSMEPVAANRRVLIRTDRNIEYLPPSVTACRSEERERVAKRITPPRSPTSPW